MNVRRRTNKGHANVFGESTGEQKADAKGDI